MQTEGFLEEEPSKLNKTGKDVGKKELQEELGEQSHEFAQAGHCKQQTFIIILEAGKSNTRVLANSVPGEDSFLVSRWSPYCMLRGDGRAQEEGEHSGVSYKSANLIMRILPS